MSQPTEPTDIFGLDELFDINGEEYTYLATSGQDFKIKTKNILKLTFIPTTISTISDLRQMVGKNKHDIKKTLGTISSTDGGGGFWLWDSESVEEDNIGTIVKPTEATIGRWKRIYEKEVNVKWFGVIQGENNTNAFRKALLVSDSVYIPPGSYNVSNLLIGNNKKLSGPNIHGAFLYQIERDKPVLHVLSDSAGFQGVSIENITVFGMGDNDSDINDKPVVIVEATGANTVRNSSFKYKARACSTALEIKCLVDVGNVYNCDFEVISHVSKSTAFIVKGVYNNFKLFATNCHRYFLNTMTSSSNYYECVGDNAVWMHGSNNVLINLSVETIYKKTSADTAIQIYGNKHTLINPKIINVKNSLCDNSFNIGAETTIINPYVIGNDSFLTIEEKNNGIKPYPTYAIVIDPTTRGKFSTIITGYISCVYKINTYLNEDILSALDMVGDTSSYYSGRKFLFKQKTGEYLQASISKTNNNVDELNFYINNSHIPVNTKISQDGLSTDILKIGKTKIYDTNKIRVLNTDTIILTWSNNNDIGTEMSPALIMVSGTYNYDNLIYFTDLILLSSTTSSRPKLINIVSQSNTEGCAPRVYTVDSTGNLLCRLTYTPLELNDNFYSIRCNVIQGYSSYR